jgi:two-component system, OmpR family, alkaline phosphatase synthesis response regulator PhoP
VKMPAKILLVDDDADFVASTKMVLESEHYKVLVANNGNEGLRKAREERPDLVLLDIIMPVADGFSAAEQFNKDPKLAKVPVLMLTSFSQKGSGTGIPRGRGYSLEAEDYIEKPVSPKNLLSIVAKHLKKA